MAQVQAKFSIRVDPAPTETVGPSGIADQPATSDALGFTPYVQAVAAFLTHQDTKPPLTVSVEGPWGSGKSSFMRQLQLEIKHCLDSQKRVTHTIWFNAWRQNKDEELWAAFALHFSDEIAHQLSIFRRLWCHIKLQWLRFEMRRAWLDVVRFICLFAVFIYASAKVVIFTRDNPNALSKLISTTSLDEKPKQAGSASQDSPTQKENKTDEVLLKLILASLGSAAYIVVALMFLKKGSEVIGNPLKIDLEKYVTDPKYDNRVSFIETFQTDFRKMVECFSRKETVFVFIDDLDRCEVPKSAELMHALNLLISDSPNVVYILGLDREKIAAGIAAKFQNVLPYLMTRPTDNSEALDFGFNYLEKFIQIPFQVPRPSLPDVDRLMKVINKDGEEPTKPEPTQPHVDPGILFETKADSELVRGIVRMVSPAFDFNPRRIKQFINCFRVQAIIASQTGMFSRQPTDSAELRPLSPPHLGKLIAICLRWPRFLNVIAENSRFLNAFPYRGPKHGPGEPPRLNEYWSQDQRLTDLVGFKEEDPSYGMRDVNISKFLTIAPRIRQPERPVRTTEEVPMSSPTQQNPGGSKGQFDESFSSSSRPPDFASQA